MKKNTLILSFITFLLVLFGGINNVSAASVTETDPNIQMNEGESLYLHWMINDDVNDPANLIYIYKDFTIDGVTAYCIEPFVSVYNVNYTEDELWEKVQINESLREKITLIAYYGYDYEGHNTQMYRLATQALIWETLLRANSISWAYDPNPNYTVSFYISKDGEENDYKTNGRLVDDSKERQEIMRLVNQHKTLPSFSSENIAGEIGETITLTDTNNVLSNFDVENTSKNNVTISGNTLTIKFNENKNNFLNFKKKQYYNKSYIVYYGGYSQNMITAGNTDPVEFTMNVLGKESSSEIIINKQGETAEIGENKFVYDKIGLPNVLFALYANEDIYLNNKLIYKKDSKIGEYLTDENGKIKISNLIKGNYYAKELKTKEDHVLSNETFIFNTKENSDGNKFEYYIDNYLIKGSLDFTKKDFSTSETLPNTVIEIYTIDDILIFTGKTDENGKIIIDELPYGKYYILEKEAPSGYELNTEKMYFEITEDGKIIKATMLDKKIKEDVKEVVLVKNTSSNSNNLYYSIILIILGAGFIVYDRKTKEKLL